MEVVVGQDLGCRWTKPAYSQGNSSVSQGVYSFGFEFDSDAKVTLAISIQKRPSIILLTSTSKVLNSFVWPFNKPEH